MAQISVRADTGQVQRFLQVRIPALIRAPVRNTISRSATYFRRELIAAIQREAPVANTSLTGRIRVIERPRADTLVAKIGISKKPITIASFKVRSKRRVPRSQAISADIDVRPGRGAVTITRAFTPIGKGKGIIFERRGAGGSRAPRKPIDFATGPSTATMFAPLKADLFDRTREFARREIQEQVNRALARINRG